MSLTIMAILSLDAVFDSKICFKSVVLPAPTVLSFGVRYVKSGSTIKKSKHCLGTILTESGEESDR